VSIDFTKQRAEASQQARLSVPWLTVVILAAVLSYADGFWMTSMRGAVGAIERTQEPFTSWWRQSTLLLPLFAFAVLGALTLAKRWFGPVLRTPRAVVLTGLLIVAAGTLAAVAAMAASSVYDYQLQSSQMEMMNTMHSSCVGGCLAQEQQATMAALGRAMLYTSGFVLLTNVLLVGWVIAVKGGRLKVSALRQPTAPTDSRVQRLPGRAEDVRLVLAAGLLGSAAIHVFVVPEHLIEWPSAGVFFVALAAAEIVVAGLVLSRLRTGALLIAVAVSVVPLAIWLWSRTVGLPFGPDPGVAEAVGLADVVCCILEIATLVAAVLLLRSGDRLRRLPAASAHVLGLVLVAVVAVTSIGLAGAAPDWFDGANDSGGDSTMTMS